MITCYRMSHDVVTSAGSETSRFTSEVVMTFWLRSISLLRTGSADRGVVHHYVILRSQNHRLKKISTMRSKSRDPLRNKLHCETNISQLLPLSICSWQLYVTGCFLMKKKESSSNVQPAIFFLKCVTFRSLFSFAGGKRFWRWVSSWVRSHWWARLYFGSNWVQIWKCGLFNYLF